jgi:hypothetical protein
MDNLNMPKSDNYLTPKRERPKKKGAKATPTKKPARKRLKKKVRAALRALPIDTLFKGLMQALEPPIDVNPGNLELSFREKLGAALASLRAANMPFKLVEGFRTVDRQQWLYGSGRTNVEPYGRPGNVVTNADGIAVKSKHQGAGIAGTGLAADCYPVREGKVYVPPSTDPIWSAYATAVEQQGLVAGFRWPRLKDSPHCEAQ